MNEIPTEIIKEAQEALGTKPKKSKLSTREKYLIDKFLKTKERQFSDGRNWNSQDKITVKELYYGYPMLYKENWHGATKDTIA